ncbi:MAG: sulfite oxidase-like oxidoreductase [Rhodobacteraceae bacterium]|nr:sulfite oxidase-like oxidoreductase [Paracoccaceae bacterium]
MTDNTDDGVELTGKIKDKLIKTKETWAQEGRGLTGKTGRPENERLPPGQRLTKDFPVLDLGVQPNLSQKEWGLSVAGQVAHPLKWSWDDFMAQPQQEYVNDIHCVTTWSRYDNSWRGVPMKTLLAACKPFPTAKFLMVKGFDGYSTNVPLADVDREDVFLGHTWNGAPLVREHGGPVRLVVPHLYFWKSAKWIRHITFMEKDQPGYWEARGYHMRGDPWEEERYD